LPDPPQAGGRIETDRRDAINLAGLHRAGALTGVRVPDPAHEATRDPVRARLAAVRSLRQARQQLSGFLLRHGCHHGRPAWTRMHRRWLAGLRFEQRAHPIVPGDGIATIEAATDRRDRLVSSGGTRRQGGVTKAGNATARRMLIEAAWSCRFPAKIGREQLLRQETLPKPIRDIAWKAQVRLCGRYRRLSRNAKPATTVTTAIARELAGVVRAVACQLPRPAS